MNRAIDWIVRLAFVALACLVFYFADQAQRQKNRAELAERRLAVVYLRAHQLEVEQTLRGLEWRLGVLMEQDARIRVR